MKCTLLGATGLVGGECLKELILRKEIEEVICPVRRPVNLSSSPKVRTVEIDFSDLNAHRECFSSEALICCLGSTRKKAGGAKERERVDLHLPLAAAAMAKEAGVRHFLVVSAQGANANSWIPYNKTKGQLEEGLSVFGFESLTIARPSLLLGKREGPRFWEDLMGKIFTAVPPPAFWRPVSSAGVARALVESLFTPPKGKRILYNRLLLLF